MPYINVTDLSIAPAQNYVNNNWVEPKQVGFTKKHILARGAYLILSPASFITNAVDIIFGLGIGMVAIGTGGLHQPTVTAGLDHFSSAKFLVVYPYLNFLRAINPEFKLNRNINDQSYIEKFFSAQQGYTSPMISSKGDGFITDTVVTYFKKKARSSYNSDGVFIKHVFSRITYVLLAVSCLVSRAVDGVIGIPTAGLSILTCGKFESLNNLAFRGLQATGIIYDLFYCTIKMINPWAGIPS